MSGRKSYYIHPAPTDFDELRLAIGKLLLSDNEHFNLNTIAEKKSGYGSRDKIAFTLGKMVECGEVRYNDFFDSFMGTEELGIAIHGETYSGVFS